MAFFALKYRATLAPYVRPVVRVAVRIVRGKRLRTNAHFCHRQAPRRNAAFGGTAVNRSPFLTARGASALESSGLSPLERRVSMQPMSLADLLAATGLGSLANLVDPLLLGLLIGALLVRQPR